MKRGKSSQKIIEQNIQQKGSYAAPCLSFDRSIAINHVSHLRMSQARPEEKKRTIVMQQLFDQIYMRQHHPPTAVPPQLERI